MSELRRWNRCIHSGKHENFLFLKENNLLTLFFISVHLSPASSSSSSSSYYPLREGALSWRSDFFRYQSRSLFYSLRSNFIRSWLYFKDQVCQWTSHAQSTAIKGYTRQCIWTWLKVENGISNSSDGNCQAPWFSENAHSTIDDERWRIETDLKALFRQQDQLTELKGMWAETNAASSRTWRNMCKLIKRTRPLAVFDALAGMRQNANARVYCGDDWLKHRRSNAVDPERGKKEANGDSPPGPPPPITGRIDIIIGTPGHCLTTALSWHIQHAMTTAMMSPNWMPST